jgi:Fur family ferric uptake transcriptional regulator
MPPTRGTRVRYTRQAAAVITVMAAMPAFSDAREIHDAVRRYGETIGLATVYRHLRVLAEHGRVDITRGAAGESRYRLRRGGITHQLTCRVCGRAVEIDGRELWDWAREVAAGAGFLLTGQVVELVGVCPDHAADEPAGRDRARPPPLPGGSARPQGEGNRPP